jgi:hypothetical protein
MKFMLGQMVATRSALEHCEEHRVDILGLIVRHMNGDWGDLSDEDKAANEAALKDGSRLFSSYNVTGGRLWIITEAMVNGVRRSTTVLLPSDY